MGNTHMPGKACAGGLIHGDGHTLYTAQVNRSVILSVIVLARSIPTGVLGYIYIIYNQ